MILHHDLLEDELRKVVIAKPKKCMLKLTVLSCGYVCRSCGLVDMCGRPLQGQEGCADGMKWLSAVLAPWLGM